jgi:triphosphatase
MEVELKYVVPDYETFEQLLSLTHLGDYWLRPAGDKRLTDHYLDTPQRAAFHGGYAVRLREDAERGQWLATLKGLSEAGAAATGEHEREEYESPVAPGAAPQAWPDGPARQHTLHLVGDQPLQELFAIGQERHKRILVGGDGGDRSRDVAELSLDVVSLPHNGSAHAVYELEVELLPDGTRDDLAALGEALRGFQLAAQSKSKFERALAIVDGSAAAVPPAAAAAPDEPQAAPAVPAKKTPKAARPKTPGVRADQTMAEAGRKVMRFHFDRMVDKQPGVRAGEDIEAVHDMRVATRRQRAALALFAAHFKRKPVRRFNGALKKLTHLLGGVRDLDVQLQAAQDYRARLPAPAAAALQPVLDAWSAERGTARTVLLDHLDGRRYRDFKKAYKKFLDAKPKRAAGLPTPTLVRQVLPGQLWDHYSEVRAYETVMAKADVPTLHALRIGSKSLRYALEFFREVLEPIVGADQTNGIGFSIEAVVALQDHIGNLHDADVTIARLQRFLADEDERQARPSPETVTAVRQYMKTKQAERQRLHGGAGRPWAVVSGTKFRRLLGKASAGL